MPVFFRFITFTFIRHIYKIARVSLFPSTWNSLAPTGQIYMKCYVWLFFKNLSRKFKFSLKS